MTTAVALDRWAPTSPAVPGLSRKLDCLGPVWIRLDGVPFGATVDVEHVLLSIEGVAVVTTVASVSGSHDPISEARWRARKVAALLRKVSPVAARPVLVVTPGDELAQGMRDGVLVATAGDAVSWLSHPSWSSLTIAPEDVGAMADVLVRHAQRTDRVNESFVRGRVVASALGAG